MGELQRASGEAMADAMMEGRMRPAWGPAKGGHDRELRRLRTLTLRASAVALAAWAASGSAEAQTLGLCRFDLATLRFAGEPVTQATCLLRRVRPRGAGSDVQRLPAWLAGHVGQPTGIAPAKLASYLTREGVEAEGALGGAVTSVDIPQRVYFVIHDTSSPEMAGPFPPSINAATWPGNNLQGWAPTALRVNLITSRDGRSRTLRNLAMERPRAATKLEVATGLAASKAFLHVENIQPRIKPAGSWGWMAPTPGFPSEQLDRLALLYVTASVRSGRWLVPAFHFNVDQNGPAGAPHDDPQNFDLPGWAAAVERIAAEVSG